MRLLVVWSLLALLATLAVAGGLDSDGDGVPDAEDCRPLDGMLWAIPPESISDLLLSRSGSTATLTWSRPDELGGNAGSERYGIYGTEDPLAFGHASGYCVELDSADLTAEDSRLPAPGDVKFYLVRAENDCGLGPVETDPPPAEERDLRYLRVDNLADDGPRSLRGQLAVASDGDAICFAVTGTINLTSGAVGTQKSVTIAGPGADLLTIDNQSGSSTTVGLALSAVLADVTVNSSSTNPNRRTINVSHGSPTIRSTTVTGGRDGILAYGNPTIIDSRITANTVGVYAYDGGSPTIISSTITGNGTGVDGYYAGLVTIRSSTVSGNTGNQISLYYYGYLVLESSTVVSDSSGAIFVGGYSEASIYSSTVRGTGSGLIVGSGSTALLRNTILAGSVSCGGNVDAVYSDGFNLATDDSCTMFTMPGDLQDTDPLLGPLADNGGPTETFALLPGSPAIDAGSCPGETADQRGLSRPVDSPSIPNAGDACDIGAYEEQ